MEYNREQTYLEYVENNINNINHFNQRAFNWQTYANGNPLPIIKNAIKQYPEISSVVSTIDAELTREKVADYYNEDLYKGVVATLLWGGAHRGPYSYFTSILEIGKDKIVASIEYLKELLSNSIEDAFLLNNNKDYHINGIGKSYWTKIMYFLKYYDNNNPKPLIFDSVMQKVHCAILIDTIGRDVATWYYIDNKGNLRLLKSDIDVYVDYINRIHQFATDYGIDKVDNLEAALFGCRYLNDFNNPRYVVKKYIEKNKDLLTVDCCNYNRIVLL